MIIDDFSAETDFQARVGGLWRAEDAHGPLAAGAGLARADSLLGRRCLRLKGVASMAEHGGELRLALDLRPDGGAFDASDFEGLSLTVMGDGRLYSLRLRTRATAKPWQDYRAYFDTDDVWRETRLPFHEFERHRTTRPLERAGLTAVALVATGRDARIDLAIAGISFYR